MRNGLAQGMIPSPPPNGSGIPGGSWDATRTEAPPELLQHGFRLAYFLFSDRSTAIDILVRALEKLRVRSRREMKRLYWRDKHAERPVRRIVRSDLDMLQWLIMFESEEDERAEERAGNLSAKSMVIRYLKHLVQITTALSSFYVNVGLTRLLHNYSTPEAQRVYEMLTSRYPGPDEYRRAKSVLMDKIGQRFAGLLKITRVDHGELRFEASHDQQRWAEVVNDCLRVFTPWSTQGHCGQFAAANSANTKPKTAYRAADCGRNEMEMTCCHILIEPSCYSQLMQELALDPPDTKLALPRFLMPEKHEQSGDGGTRWRPPELSEEELDKIQRRLAATDTRRRNINPRIAAVAIDGVEHTQLDLAQKTHLEIGLEAGASLIEIRGEDERGEVLLATHFVSYISNEFDSSRATATFGKGRLKLGVTPIATLGQAPPRAILSLNYQPNFQLTRPWAAWPDVRGYWRTIRAYALAGMAVALMGWGVAGAFYAHKVKVLEQQLQQDRRNQLQLLPTAARAIVSYTLTRDEERVRGIETAGVPEISLRLHSSAVSLELPLSQTVEADRYSADLKTFTGDRTLMTQNFLRPMRTDAGWVVEIVLPAGLLQADGYYTVHLHSSDRTDRFTFRVVADQH